MRFFAVLVWPVSSPCCLPDSYVGVVTSYVWMTPDYQSRYSTENWWKGFVTEAVLNFVSRTV